MRLLPGALCALCFSLATKVSTFGQSPDETVVAGVNTAQSVRVNCLANGEALVNIFANGFEIAGILVSAVLFVRAITRDCNGQKRCKALMVAMLPLVFGLSTPGVVNWLMATARDANLFS